MGEQHVQRDDRLMRQAIAWFTRLHADDISDAEREAHAEWLLSDPSHADAYAQVEQQWQALETTRSAVLQNYAAETEELTRQASNPSVWRFGWHNLLGGRPVLRGALAGAAVLVLVLIGGLIAATLSSGPTSRQMLQTGRGELATVNLPDGSMADLDADTQMTFVRNRKLRTIELHRGAAVFDVAPNRQQPFTVAAGEVTFTAVGTAFEVSYRDNAAVITMQEGKVIARHGVQTGYVYELSAGDRLAYPANSAVPVRSRVAPDQVGLWHQGQSVFEQQSLHGVVQHLNRYFRQGQLHVADAGTGGLLFSGVIQHAATPETIAQRLAGVLPVTYSVTGEQVTLYSTSNP